MSDEKAYANTDRELWREIPGDFYAPSIHVTERGAIGIAVGGTVFVRPVRTWHELAATVTQLQQQVADLTAGAEEKPPCEFCAHEDKGATEEPCIDCEQIGFANWSQYKPIFDGSPAWGDLLHYLRSEGKIGLARIVREGMELIKCLTAERDLFKHGNRIASERCAELEAERVAIAKAALEAAAKTIPGGSICDPQHVADAIRRIDPATIVASVEGKS